LLGWRWSGCEAFKVVGVQMIVAQFVVPSFWEQMLSHLSMVVLFLSLVMPAILAVLYRKRFWRKLIVVVIAVIFEIVTVIVVLVQMSNGFLLSGYLYTFFGKVVVWILCFRGLKGRAERSDVSLKSVDDRKKRV